MAIFVNKEPYVTRRDIVCIGGGFPATTLLWSLWKGFEFIRIILVVQGEGDEASVLGSYLISNDNGDKLEAGKPVLSGRRSNVPSVLP